MSRKRLNPFEKEFLIRQFRENNEQRPSYALGYDTPNDFYRRFINGEIERKNNFTRRFEDDPDNIR